MKKNKEEQCTREEMSNNHGVLIRNDDGDVSILFSTFWIWMSDVVFYYDVFVWISSNRSRNPQNYLCLVIDCNRTKGNIFISSMLVRSSNPYCRFRLLFSCFFDLLLASESFLVPCCLSRLISSIERKGWLLSRDEMKYLPRVSC